MTHNYDITYCASPNCKNECRRKPPEGIETERASFAYFCGEPKTKYIDAVYTEKYDGTIESALHVIKNLKVKDNMYHFDIGTGMLHLYDKLMLEKGDYYQYRKQSWD